MTKKMKLMVAGGALLVIGTGSAVGGHAAYTNYADGRCIQDLQHVEDTAYADMFALTGDTEQSLEYRLRQQTQVMLSGWCTAS